MSLSLMILLTAILHSSWEEKERIAKETGKRVRTCIFGQELQPDTYATSQKI